MPGFKYERYNRAIKPVPQSTAPFIMEYIGNWAEEERMRHWRTLEEQARQRELWYSADGRLFTNPIDALNASGGLHDQLGFKNCGNDPNY